MKTKIYLFLCLSFLLISCAEEGPFSMGKLKCEVTIESITQTSALIHISYPDTKDNLLSNTTESWNKVAYLSETPLQNNTQVSNSDWISHVSYYQNGICFFSNLKPNTKYYVICRSRINYNDVNSEYNEVNYYTGASFTTPKEGDYSYIREIKVEYIDDIIIDDSNYTLIKLCAPSYYSFRYDDQGSNVDLQMSLSESMTDEIWGEWNFSNPTQLRIKYNLADNELLYRFPRLEKKKYYYRYDGKMSLQNQKLLNIDANILLEGSIELSAL